MKKLRFIILTLLAIACFVFILELILWGKMKKEDAVSSMSQPETSEIVTEQPATETPSIEQETLEELQARATGPTLIVSNVNAKQGDTVDVTVTVVNNPGILGMTATLSFDESALTLISAEKGEAFGDVLEMTCSETLGNGCVFLWDGLDLTPEQISDGDILHLEFKVSESAPVGRYPIVLVLDQEGVYDRDLTPISITTEYGYISVYE